MQIFSSKSPLFARQPVSTLDTIAVGTLIGTAVLCGLLALVAAKIVLVMAAAAFVIAALITTGIRWIPALGCLLSAIILYAFLLQTSFPIEHLTHPKDALGNTAISFVLFVVILLILWCVVIAFAACAAALVQNYWTGGPRHARWPRLALMTMVGFLAGAMFIAALAQPSTSVATNSTAASGTSTVHMGIASFSQSSITIAKGSQLTLIDDGTFHHNLANGTWVNGQPQPASEPGAPVVNNLDVNGKSVEIGPFNTAGVYHIYCTIHSGMTLTITVH